MSTLNDAGRFLPVTGMVLPRFAGIATFMRLPYVPLTDALIELVEGQRAVVIGAGQAEAELHQRLLA